MNKNTLYVLLGVLGLIIIVGGIGVYKFRRQIRALISGTPKVEEQAATPAPAAPVAPTPSPAATGSTPAGTVSSQMEVDYAANGFTPASITVKKGTMVKFVNKTSGPMSVASNPHPTHTDYPGFDQGKSNFQGTNEYDFTFTKTGTWGYHNHLQASDGGTVIVTE